MSRRIPTDAVGNLRSITLNTGGVGAPTMIGLTSIWNGAGLLRACDWKATMDLLRMTDLRKSSKDRCIEPIGDGEILTHFMHGRHLGVAGVGEHQKVGGPASRGFGCPQSAGWDVNPCKERM